MLGCRHAKSAFRARLPLTPERSAECCGGEATTGLSLLPRSIRRYSESFRSPQSGFRERFPQGRRRPQQPGPVGAHPEGMNRARKEHRTGPPGQHRTGRGTSPGALHRTPHRLITLAAALLTCGSMAALPPPSLSSVSPPATTAEAPVAGLSSGLIPSPPSAQAVELQDPAFPELRTEAAGATVSLFTDASLITRFVEETEAGTEAGPQEGLGQPPEPRRPHGRYQWPTGTPATVVEGFDPPAVAWGRGHRGVDLAAAEGTQIRSAAAGTVAFAGMVAGRPVVSIDHTDGIRTTYEPVEPTVGAGDTVDVGQVIGTLLPGHRSDGVCALHWGARTGPKTYINPLRLLQPAVIRLKPVRWDR